MLTEFVLLRPGRTPLRFTAEASIMPRGVVVRWPNWPVTNETRPVTVVGVELRLTPEPSLTCGVSEDNSRLVKITQVVTCTESGR